MTIQGPHRFSQAVSIPAVYSDATGEKKVSARKVSGFLTPFSRDKLIPAPFQIGAPWCRRRCDGWVKSMGIRRAASGEAAERCFERVERRRIRGSRMEDRGSRKLEKP